MANKRNARTLLKAIGYGLAETIHKTHVTRTHADAWTVADSNTNRVIGLAKVDTMENICNQLYPKNMVVREWAKANVQIFYEQRLKQLRLEDLISSK